MLHVQPSNIMTISIIIDNIKDNKVKVLLKLIMI